MLGTFRQPADDPRGQIAGGIDRGNPVSRRYTIAPAAPTGEQPCPSGWRRLLQLRRAVESWLRRLRQRRALVRLNTRMLRDIGLSPDSFSSSHEEKRACSVPFRLPRQ